MSTEVRRELTEAAPRPGAAGLSPAFSPDERVAGYEAIIDSSGDGYTVLRAERRDGVIVDWSIMDANALVRNRWRSSIGNVIGTSFSALNAAADNSSFTSLFETALTTGARQVQDLNLRLPSRNGGWRRVIVVPLNGDSVAVITRDITREQYFESALQKNREALHALTHVPARLGRTGFGIVDTARFVSWSAAALFLGAGLLTVLNSYFGHLRGTDSGALRMTGIVSIAAALGVPFLPWSRHRRAMAAALVLGALAFVVVSDHFNHYSHLDAAVAVYPVFFIIIVAWSGLTLGRGAASVTACISGLALARVLVAGGHTQVSLQCIFVTMPAAAILGEVLSWSFNRTSELARLEVDRQVHDPLTGLASRRQFIEHVDQALARVRRTQQAAGVLFIDLDRFKQVNDSFGHALGDQLLIEAASRLREAVRECDEVARFGGDEFAVLCENLTGADDATTVAERILLAFEMPFSFGESEAYVAASIGIAFSTHGCEVSDTIIQDADVAMYRAKEAGRGRFEIFDETMKQWVADRVELESALRQAIPRGELRAFYQPIVQGSTNTVVGVEALIRWQRPGFGLVAPSNFVPVAEETGIIVDIGAWILDEACRQAARWASLWPERRLGVAVNISSRQVLRSDLVRLVGEALATSGLLPELLTLELTETTLIDDGTTVQRVLRDLRALGVNLALDDFGTGYSSLNYLRQFPINIIKIDGSFVRTMETEHEARAIVKAIVALATDLDMQVVAEGIETADQCAAARSLRCDLLQGYLFSEPRPVEEITELVLHGPGAHWTCVAPTASGR